MKKLNKKYITGGILAALALALAFQLGYNAGLRNTIEAEEIFVIDGSHDTVPLAAMPVISPAVSTVLTNEASGRNVNRNAKAEVDFSNAADGYIMARWMDRSASNADVRVVIVGPNGVQYQYRLNTAGRWESFPLSGGNGNYIVRVMEGIGGGRFAVTNTVNISLTLNDEFAPFLRPNQFVNFTPQSAVVTLANEIVVDASSVLESVQNVYHWVVNNIDYDTELAQTVQSGYVPNLDEVLRVRRGICFDYASLMTAMLRSQGIPTRLVIGYVGTTRHAWISVYSEQDGWIDNVIQFNGNEWRIMDPTFSATGNREEVRRFVGNGENHRQTHVH